MSSTVDIVWSVGNVLPDGVATVVQRVQRVRAKLAERDATLVMDSNDPREIDPRFASFAAMLRTPSEFTVGPNGRVSSTAKASETVSEQGFGTPFPTFPDRESRKVGTWEQIQGVSAQLGFGGTMHSVTTYRRVGPEVHDGKLLARVDFELELRPGDGRDVSLDAQSGGGHLHFDSDAGHLVDLVAEGAVNVSVRSQAIPVSMVLRYSTRLNLVDRNAR